MQHAKTMLSAMATLLMVACVTEDITTPREQSNAVRITTTINSAFTRSNPTATDDKQTAFNAGDIISVSDELGKTALYRYNGNSNWTPTDNNTFLTWDKGNKTFRAFYPANGTNTFQEGHILADQTTLEQIAKSDFMRDAIDCSQEPTDRTITLRMYRQTSRVIIRINHFNNQFAEGTKVNHVTLSSTETTANNATNTIMVSPLTNGEGTVGTTYTALVAGSSSQVKLYLTSDPNEEPLTTTISSLSQGKSYTYDLNVGKNKIEIAKVTVADWSTGEVLSGKTQRVPSVNGNTVYTIKGGDLTEQLINEALGSGQTIKICGPMSNSDFSTLKNCLVSKDKAFDIDFSEVKAETISDMSNMYSANYLRNVALPIKLKKIGKAAFEESHNINITNWEQLTNLEEIEEGAFANSNLGANVVLLDQVQKVGNYAFGNSTIKSITFPHNVVLGKMICWQCKSLESITFRGNMNMTEVINQFADCTSLKTIDFSNCTTVPDISAANNTDNDAFEYITRSNTTLYVPTGMTKEFENNGWTGFNIVEK